MGFDAIELNAWYAAVEASVGYAKKCRMFIPENILGARILDVNCRRGKGAYKLSEAVGPEGFVLGVDPTAENIAAAQAGAAGACGRSGLTESNMAFAVAFPEMLDSVAAPGTFDLVYLNSSLNTCFDPATVLAQVAASLKAGGRLVCLTVCADVACEEADREAGRCAGDAVLSAPTLPMLRDALMAAGLEIDEMAEEAPVENCLTHRSVVVIARKKA